MTHRCLILSLSAVLACGASTVRADRRMPRPADEHAAASPDFSPYRQVDWEILAGCPECAGLTGGRARNRERLEAATAPGLNAPEPLYGNELAMEINRLNDGLADAPVGVLYGDALAREINRLNDGLATPVARRTPTPRFNPREKETSVASRETDTYHQILGARGEWIFVSTNSPLGRKVRELVLTEPSSQDTAVDGNRAAASKWPPTLLRATAEAAMVEASFSNTVDHLLTPRGEIARLVNRTTEPEETQMTSRCQNSDATDEPSAPQLDIEVFTPCADDVALSDEVSEVNATATDSRTTSSSGDADDAAFNDPHCSDPVFDDEVVAGGSVVDTAPREIAPIETSGPQAVIPFSIDDSGDWPTTSYENAELRWEMSYLADARANDCQLNDTEGHSGVARLRVRQDAQDYIGRGMTREAFTGLAHQIALPVKQAGGQIATAAAHALRDVLKTVYQARDETISQAQRAVPYRGL